MTAGRFGSRTVVTAVLGLVALYFLMPVWWLFVAATKTTGDLSTTNGFWFSAMHLGDNISTLFKQGHGEYGRWLLNSVLYAGGGALLGTLLAVMAGYALAKYSFKGREAVFNTVLAAVLVPAPLLALPLYLLFTKVDLVNTYWAVLLPSIVSPFGVYLSRIYAAASVPDEVLEAARLDGSGELRTFFTVSLRMMAPALVTIFLFQFVAVWNNYLLPLVMLNDNDKAWPVTVGLAYWNSLRVPARPDLVIIGSALAVIPLIIIFLALQRFWRAGLSAGSIK